MVGLESYGKTVPAALSSRTILPSIDAKTLKGATPMNCLQRRRQRGRREKESGDPTPESSLTAWHLAEISS
jgi:hypothetical protein